MRSVVSCGSTKETLAVALCLTLVFVGVFNHELDYRDEPRVTAIALKMSRDGNLVVPHLGKSAFVEKPPMYFAAAAGALQLFGDSMDPSSVMRLTSALWGIGCLAMTFLLARRLALRRLGTHDDAGRRASASALLTATVLLTTIGFGTNLHFIRVDIALAFFVVAAVWAFAEVYLENRSRFLPLGGAFLAGAFLCKGLVGIALIGIAWSALAIPWFLEKRREGKLGELHVAHHLLALGVFLVGTGIWVVLLRVVGGEALWDEWFWRNQLGRFVGDARLGHERPGRVFYYLVATANYTLPWLPLVVLWFWRTVRDFRARGRLSRDQMFLLFWCLGSLVLLTSSTGKRRVYLLPLLPAYALMCGEILSQALPRFYRVIYNVWIGACLASLVVLALAPVLYSFIPDALMRHFNGVPAQWSLWNAAIVVAALVLMIRFPSRERRFRIVCVTALTFIGFSAIGRPLVERGTELRAMVERFVPQVDPDRRPRTAGLLSESMRGLLYIHAGWVPPQVDRQRFPRIVEGRDPEYDAVITNWTDFSGTIDSPYTLLAQESTAEKDDGSSHFRALQWVSSGNEHESADPVKSQRCRSPQSGGLNAP